MTETQIAERPRDVVAIAEEYYDSGDADKFYFDVWGGEDIHIGLYDGTDDIKEASRRTVERMASKLTSGSSKWAASRPAGSPSRSPAGSTASPRSAMR